VTNIGNTGVNTTQTEVPVQQLTLDSLNLTKLNFIKMDIQGSELKCLRGAKNTILTNKPFMFMEIEEKQLVNFNTTSSELIEYTKSLGYKLYRIVVNSYVTDDHLCIPISRNDIDLSNYPYELKEV